MTNIRMTNILRQQQENNTNCKVNTVQPFPPFFFSSVQYQESVNISTFVTNQHQTTLRHESATKQTSTFDQTKSRVIIVKTFG